VKSEAEFFPAEGMSWEPAAQAGTYERVLSRDEADPEVLTRLVRWEAGLDTSSAGVIRHEWIEEVYLLGGDLHDLTLGRTFGAGHYASRTPGMPHGPYRTAEGCVMLEIRHRP